MLLDMASCLDSLCDEETRASQARRVPETSFGPAGVDKPLESITDVA
jgi:hypothetical protein